MGTPIVLAKSALTLAMASEGDAPIPERIDSAVFDLIRETVFSLPAPHFEFLRLDLVERRSPDAILRVLHLRNRRAFLRRKHQAFAALLAALRARL